MIVPIVQTKNSVHYLQVLACALLIITFIGAPLRPYSGLSSAAASGSLSLKLEHLEFEPT